MVVGAWVRGPRFFNENINIEPGSPKEQGFSKEQGCRVFPTSFLTEQCSGPVDFFLSI